MPAECLLDERFNRPTPDPRLRWLAPPSRWSIDPARGVLSLEPDAGTDFWQKTHYGFQADNGHLLACELPVTLDWTMSTHVRWRPEHQYDQAGLMVRLGPGEWIKTSVEYEPEGASRLGVVVTRGGYSDWSTQDLVDDPGEGVFRIERRGGDYRVEFSRCLSPAPAGTVDGPTGPVAAWTQLRVAHLEEASGSSLLAGLYACSPKSSGMRAEFTRLRIETP